MLKKVVRAKYTPEFKQEAVRMAEAKGSIAEASRELGLPEQTLFNWVKAEREGRLKASGSRQALSDEHMENARLRARVARLEMECEILKKRLRISPGARCEIRRC